MHLFLAKVSVQICLIKLAFAFYFAQGAQCLRTDLKVCGSKRLCCHADLYTVSRYRTKGESEDNAREKARKGSTLALKLSSDVTRSPKSELSVGPRKILKKEKKMCTVQTGWTCMKWLHDCSNIMLNLFYLLICNYGNYKPTYIHVYFAQADHFFFLLARFYSMVFDWLRYASHLDFKFISVLSAGK